MNQRSGETGPPGQTDSEKERGQEGLEDVSNDAVIGVALTWSLGLLALLIIGGIAAWAIFAKRTDVVQEQVFEPVAPEIRVVDSVVPDLPMKDITAESGVDFRHETGRTGDKLLPETMGSGVAVIDYNNDGNQDLFFVNSQRWSWDDTADDSKTESSCKLYQGSGDGTFTDVTETSGTGISLYGMGVAAGDFDNDADVDLFISAVGKNVMLRNDSGVFVDVTDVAGIGGDDTAWSTSCGFFDYDRDGRLDLFVCNYVTWDKELDLSQKFTLDGASRAYGPPRAFTGSYSYLYHNEGDGTFSDVSSGAGIEVRNPDTGVPLGKSMGLAFVDANRDGWLDIMVANDTVRNFLFQNNRDGTFDECGQLCGIAYDRSGNARGAMGIDSGLFRDDGTLAIGIGNFANEPSALYIARPGRTQFIDAAMATGFATPTRQGLTFGLFFFDVDLDGRMDVFGANGHLEEEIAATQKTQRYAQPPQLFWNAGPGASSELVEVTAEKTGDAFLRPMVGRGAAFGDFDNDGDQDIVVSTSGGTPKLFRNDQGTSRHFLRLNLIGTDSNRDAIGSLVTVTTSSQVVRATVMPTKSYLSQCEKTLTIGLGDSTDIELIHVVWPNGETQEFSIDSVDRTVTLTQGGEAS